MLQSFIIILREGFESFLLVAVILSYLRKSGRRQLAPAVYWAIGIGLAVSGGLGYLLYQMQTRSEEHTSELQSRFELVCRLLLEKKKQPSRAESQCGKMYGLLRNRAPLHPASLRQPLRG